MAIAYRIKFKQADTEFEIEGDKRYVTATYNDLKGVLGLAPQTATAVLTGTKPTKSEPTKTLGRKTSSPREFIDRYGLKRHVDIVLAFGYFLEKVRGLKGFTGADINSCYYEAKVETSNTSQMIINNIKKGLIMQQSKKKGSRANFTLTRTGEEFVEAGFKTTKAK